MVTEAQLPIQHRGRGSNPDGGGQRTYPGWNPPQGKAEKERSGQKSPGTAWHQVNNEGAEERGGIQHGAERRPERQVPGLRKLPPCDRDLGGRLISRRTPFLLLSFSSPGCSAVARPQQPWRAQS